MAAGFSRGLWLCAGCSDPRRPSCPRCALNFSAAAPCCAALFFPFLYAAISKFPLFLLRPNLHDRQSHPRSSEHRSFPTAFSSREALASPLNSEPLRQPGRNVSCYLRKADQLPVPSLTLHLQTQEYPFFNVGRAPALPVGSVCTSFELTDLFSSLPEEPSGDD